MLTLIIFRTRGVTYGTGEGRFFCPQCGDEQHYARKRVRRFFTLDFIPVIPMDLLGEYVECRGCRDTFKPEVLDYDPGASAAEFEAEFQKAIMRVMVQMMMADGVIDDEEIASIREIYGNVSGKPVTAGAVRREIETVEKDRRDVAEYLAKIEPSLNDRGKELVLSAALMVAFADGTFQDEERELFSRIARALRISPAHLRGLITEMTEK
jgi:tellurite resistance protein